MWKLKNECINMYWPGWWRHTELAQGHVAGSIFLFFFVQKNWAGYEALSQKRCIEPATWHWASNEGMVKSVLYGTDGFSDAAFAVPTNQIIDKFWHRQSIHIYVYIYNPNRIIMVNLRQHQFSWGRRVPLSWREFGKSNFRLIVIIFW